MTRYLLALGIGLLAMAPAARAADDEDSAKIVYDVSDHLVASGSFNIVTFNAPRDFKLAALGLKEAGLKGGDDILTSDEIRVWNNQDDMDGSPAARIWINSAESNQFWFQTGGTGAAEDFEIKRGQAVAIVTKASTADVAWTNAFRQADD